MLTRSRLWPLLCASTLAVAPRAAIAQVRDAGPPPSTTQASPQRASVAQARAAITSTDAATVRGGIEQWRRIGGTPAVQALSARIRDGLPPDLLDLAIDALVALRRPEGAPVLAELVEYRRASVRRKAIEAIVATRATAAESALVGALADEDPNVRGAAARGLASIGARGSIGALFVAFERGLPEAAPALGTLARPMHVGRIVGYLDAKPFASVAPALAELLRRRDIPVAARIATIGTIATHNVADVRSFLQQLASGLPTGDPVRTAAEAAIRATEQPVESPPSVAPQAAPAAAPPLVPAAAAATPGATR